MFEYDFSKKVWEKQKGEPTKAHQGFEIYRSLGPQRSIQKAWEQYQTRETPGKMPGYFKDWSAKYEWVARSEAWDHHVVEQAQAAELEERRRIAREHARAGKILREVGYMGLSNLLQDQDRVVSLPPLTLAKMIKEGIAIEREALALEELPSQETDDGLTEEERLVQNLVSVRTAEELYRFKQEDKIFGRDREYLHWNFTDDELREAGFSELGVREINPEPVLSWEEQAEIMRAEKAAAAEEGDW